MGRQRRCDLHLSQLRCSADSTGGRSCYGRAQAISNRPMKVRHLRIHRLGELQLRQRSNVVAFTDRRQGPCNFDRGSPGIVLQSLCCCLPSKTSCTLRRQAPHSGPQHGNTDALREWIARGDETAHGACSCLCQPTQLAFSACPSQRPGLRGDGLGINGRYRDG